MADSDDKSPERPPANGPWREPIADGLGQETRGGSPLRRGNRGNQEFVPPSADYFPQPKPPPPPAPPPAPAKASKLSRRQRNQQRPLNPTWEPDPLSAWGMPQYQAPSGVSQPQSQPPAPTPTAEHYVAQQNYYDKSNVSPSLERESRDDDRGSSSMPGWPTTHTMPESLRAVDKKVADTAAREDNPAQNQPPVPQVPSTPPPIPVQHPTPSVPRVGWNVPSPVAPQRPSSAGWGSATDERFPAHTPFTTARPDVSGQHQQLASPRPQGPSHDQLGLIRSVKPLPKSGWRKAVHRLSGGAVNPGESPEESARSLLIERINAPVRGDYRIAVLSLKGGVGKTTTTFSLGATFASLRGDRVIAVDANPDFGTLAQRGPDETRSTARDLLRDPDIHRYSDVRRHTSQSASRLEVLASERDPAASELFSEADYVAVMGILQRFYNIILTDCGTGLMHSAMAGVLGEANAIVLVTSPAIDGARSALATLDWLDHHGYSHLVRQSVVAISSSRPGASSVDLEQLSRHFLTRARAVHIIPFDNHLSEGSEISLDLMSKKTRMAFMELAAAVADGFYEGGRDRNRAWG